MKLPDGIAWVRFVGTFWSQVAIAGPDECWDWTGGKRKGEYGGFKFDGASHLAHRVAYFLEYKEWPTVVRHTCDRPICCNPRHLVGGEQADNIAEAAARERMHSKISAEDAREIARSAEKGTVLAERYGVSPALVSMIRNGKARTHATAQ